MNSSGEIDEGARVRILRPIEIAGKLGIILSHEEIVEGEITDRWIIQLTDSKAERVILSLPPEDFQLID